MQKWFHKAMDTITDWWFRRRLAHAAEQRQAELKRIYSQRSKKGWQTRKRRAAQKESPRPLGDGNEGVAA